jgi:hypothetical protein
MDAYHEKYKPLVDDGILAKELAIILTCYERSTGDNITVDAEKMQSVHANGGRPMMHSTKEKRDIQLFRFDHLAFLPRQNGDADDRKYIYLLKLWIKILDI